MRFQATDIRAEAGRKPAEASPVGARSHDLVEQVVRQRLAALVVLGQGQQRGLVIAPVLHELAGKLYSIPLYAVYASYIQILLLRQHVLQRVAELVEQGFYLPARRK